jgi:hypothetical protein
MNIAQTLAQAPADITTKAEYLAYIAQWRIAYSIVSDLCRLTKCWNRLTHNVGKDKKAMLESRVAKAEARLKAHNPADVAAVEGMVTRGTTVRRIRNGVLHQTWGAQALAFQLLEQRAAHKAHAWEQCQAAKAARAASAQVASV